MYGYVGEIVRSTIFYSLKGSIANNVMQPQHKYLIAFNLALLVLSQVGKNRPQVLKRIGPFMVGVVSGATLAASFNNIDKLPEVDLDTKKLVIYLLGAIGVTTLYHILAPAIDKFFKKYIRRIVLPTADKFNINEKPVYKTAGTIMFTLYAGLLTGIMSMYLLLYKKFNYKPALKELAIVGGFSMGSLILSTLFKRYFDSDNVDIQKALKVKQLTSKPSKSLLKIMLDNVMSGMKSSVQTQFTNDIDTNSVVLTDKGIKVSVVKDCLDKGKITQKDAEKYDKAINDLFNKLKSQFPDYYDTATKKLKGIYLLCGKYFNAFASTNLIAMIVDKKVYPTLTQEEVSAIMAHEIYHFVNKHVFINIFMMANSIMFTILALSTKIPAKLMFLTEATLTLFTLTIQRHFEVGSDAFGATLYGQNMANALLKLKNIGIKIDIDYDTPHGNLEDRAEDILRRVVRYKKAQK